MNEADDNTELGWGGEGTSSTGGPPSPPAGSPTVADPSAAVDADAPTVAQPAAPAPPPPPQPLGVPAPTPGVPTPVAAPGAGVPGRPEVPPVPPPAFQPQGGTGPIPAVGTPGYPGYPGVPTGAAPSNRGLWIALAILSTIVVIGAVVAAVLLLRGSDTTTSGTLPATSSPTSSSSSSTTTSLPATTAPAVTAPATTAPPPQTVPTVGSLPGGLYCKDLAARGVGYSDAVRYYKREGYPDRMDADGNGIPCETVYSASAVQDYWGTVRTGSTLGLPSGLMCKDLHNRGLDYGSAVEYWIADGFPDRMDADHNGIPCETVYSASEVRAFWDTVN